MTTPFTPNTPSPRSVGEVARRTGLSVHALRYYEREGLLLAPISRAPGGQREYTANDVKWLLICVRLRESGMPLAELKRFAALVREGPGNEPERLALLEAQRDRIDAQIHALEASRSVIEWKVDIYARRLREGSAEGFWSPVPPAHERVSE